MRKPARNGNPGSLESGLAVQRRHFLRGRWRDLAFPADVAALKALWVNMTPEQESASRALLDDFSRWKPGPAGRGGERSSRKRGSEDGDSGNEADSPDRNEAYAGTWEPQAQLSALWPQTPFGGWKASGFGKEWGEAGMHEYLRHKTVTKTVRPGVVWPYHAE